MKITIAQTDFLQHLLVERGLSSHTIEAYKRDISRFIQTFPKDSEVDIITAQAIIAHLTSLKAEEYATASLARALIAIKVFCRFLKSESYLPTNIAFHLNTPKVWQLIPDLLSPSEVEQLIMAAQPTTSRGIRDRAILELLYSCGLRASELCQLSLYDVDDEYVKILGKGNKERLVPLGKPALKAIDLYLTHCRGPCDDSSSPPPLFVTRSGARIDRILVWRLVKEYGKRAGISKIISPHTLRHAFATHLLDNGADLRVIQEMMGHSHIGSTDRYMHLSRQKIHRAFEAYHPHNK